MNEHEIAAMWEQFGAEHPHLEPTDRNGEMLMAWVVEQGAMISIESLRVAAKVLVNELERVPAPAAPAAAVEPQPEPPKAEVLGECSDGRPQLPIDASEHALRKASKAQVLDVLNRRREAANIRYNFYPSHRRAQEKF